MEDQRDIIKISDYVETAADETPESTDSDSHSRTFADHFANVTGIEWHEMPGVYQVAWILNAIQSRTRSTVDAGKQWPDVPVHTALGLGMRGVFGSLLTRRQAATEETNVPIHLQERNVTKDRLRTLFIEIPALTVALGYYFASNLWDRDKGDDTTSHPPLT